MVRSFYAAVESGQHGEQLAGLLADDARTVERPNLVSPSGRVSDRDAMLAASTAGARLLASQRYDVRSVLEVGDLVVTRLTWTGTVAVDAGPFHAGQQLTAHIAQFVRVVDGRVAEIETYDCYEPVT
ncbi:nuclear transport factor 2 family protein [Nocardioides sp. J54]|uniref:nuclear transport factor 2 family protein n=1 Tax=Nocardioides sp. J54 TaxID=935866 RepID=UPI00048DD342|nr:nuclear transport factor 2 family protein [Nocardioides sp. J54]